MRSILSVLIAGIMLATSSCMSVKPVQYFEGDTDSIPKEIQYMEPAIQAGDLLSIVIFSDNALASSQYNQSASAVTGSGVLNMPSQSGGGQSGYLVNHDGNIIIPNIGSMKVAGLSKKQLADTLVSYFTRNDLLKNPHCDIRFLNYRFTLLGEVARPGVYTVPVEKVSVLEAVGIAGDVTIWAKRDKVTIIREINGQRELARLDLTKPDIFSSPYYYLKQNDIVVIGQNKRKATSTDQTTLRYVAISTSVISAIAIIINVFK